MKYPQLPLEPQLITEPEAFLTMLSGENDLTNFQFQGLNISFSQPTPLCPQREGSFGLCFRKGIFRHCQLLHGILAKTSFQDTLFSGCDFSNSDLSEAFFQRCLFQDCKGLGTDFSGGHFQQVAINSCNLRYANFDRCKFTTVTVEASDLGGAKLTQCKLKGLELAKVRFQGASFFHTMLKGVDFTQCQIPDILVSQDKSELNGAIVSLLQGAELSRLLGLVIR